MKSKPYRIAELVRQNICPVCKNAIGGKYTMIGPLMIHSGDCEEKAHRRLMRLWDLMMSDEFKDNAE